MLVSYNFTFAINHMINPAGAATETALPRTNNARSNIERVITFVICGFRYGGNSRVYDEGTPFSNVDESNLVVKNVTRIPRMRTNVKIIADKTDE